MIKQLTAEGRFECGLAGLTAGKAWAFVAVLGQGNSYGLGVAIANEPGYHPIPLTWCHGDDWDEMSGHADALNKVEGLGVEAAARIVCSTMKPVAKPVRFRCASGAEVLAYIFKSGGDWRCALPNGTPCAFSYGIGHCDEMAVRFALADAANDEVRRALLQRLAGRGHVERTVSII